MEFRKTSRLRFLAVLLVCILICSSMSGCVFGQIAADYIASQLDAFQAQQGQGTAGQNGQSGQNPQGGDMEFDGEEHGLIDFADIEYYHPDIDALMAEVEKLQTVADTGDKDAFIEQCNLVDEMYEEASTQYTLASLMNSLDIFDEYYENEYTTLYDELLDVDFRYNDIMVPLIENGWRDALTEEFGEQYVEDILLDDMLYDESAKDLFSRENELELEYDRICAETTFNYRGKEWTLDDIMADETLDYYTYYGLVNQYCKVLSDNLAGVYTELVRIRCDIAETIGFDSYNEYRYLCYDRDYTPDDAKEFHEAVKNEIVPVYNENYYDVIDLGRGGLFSRTFDQDTIMQSLPAYFRAISPKIEESYQYMLKYHLYDIDVSDTKEEGAYTTYLDSYKSPFLFASFEDDMWSIQTIIHESGHFASFYHNPGDGPLDLAEIDSQGLEMMMMSQYADIFGEDAGPAAGYQLVNMLSSVIQGSMYDEFQQIIYDEKDLTMEEIANVFDGLLDEYGIREQYPASKYEWVLVHHNFSAPLYYISYAVSAVPALEIWQIARQDFEVGKELYLSLYERDHDRDYSEVLADLGFSDPFDYRTLQTIGRDVEEELLRIEQGNWTFQAD